MDKNWLENYINEIVSNNGLFSSAGNVEHIRLLNEVLISVSGSQEETDLIEQLNALRIKGGMIPLN